MTLGPQELLLVVGVLCLFFGPAVLLYFGGYAMGRRRGREEAAGSAPATPRAPAQVPSAAAPAPAQPDGDDTDEDDDDG